MKRLKGEEKMSRFIRLAVCVIAGLGLAASSQAAVFSYHADLNGANEFPSNASPATGFAQVDYDDIARTLHVQASFSGLTGTTTVSHIHSPTLVPFAGTAGVATTTPTFFGFPAGVTSGVYDNILDLTQPSSWNPAYITNNGGTPAGAEASLALSMAEGKAYFNIHTSLYGGGEIRGFLIPEPVSLLLLGLGGLMIPKNRG